MTWNLQTVLTALVALLTIVGTIIGAVRWSVRELVAKARKQDDFLGDWYGEAARPGVARRPGVMERLADQDRALAEIKGELTTNGGSSLKDRVVSVDNRLSEVERKVGNPVTVNVNQPSLAAPPPA